MDSEKKESLQNTKDSEKKDSLQKTIEQKRAGQAWEYIDGIKKQKDQKYKGYYSSWAKKFPTLVLTNGLGPTLAFFRSKGKEKHMADLYDHVSKWVTSQVYGTSDSQLLERLIGAVPGCQSNSLIYRRATTEALAFAAWLKRFAEAELEERL